MKANELRVNNLIYCNGEIISINWVALYGVQARTEDGSIINAKFSTPDLNPIPLTEEWLLKFGGQKIPHFTISNSIIIKLKRNIQLSFGCVGTPNFALFIQELEGKNITDLMCIHNYDYDGEFYVHQLQNLYFALTGKELTIKL